MTESAARLKPELAALTIQDRAELASFLIDSLGGADPGWDAAWKLELERRWEEIACGQEAGVPTELAFRQLCEKVS